MAAPSTHYKHITLSLVETVNRHPLPLFLSFSIPLFSLSLSLTPCPSTSGVCLCVSVLLCMRACVCVCVCVCVAGHVPVKLLRQLRFCEHAEKRFCYSGIRSTTTCSSKSERHSPNKPAYWSCNLWNNWDCFSLSLSLSLSLLPPLSLIHSHTHKPRTSLPLSLSRSDPPPLSFSPPSSRSKLWDLDSDLKGPAHTQPFVCVCVCVCVCVSGSPSWQTQQHCPLPQVVTRYHLVNTVTRAHVHTHISINYFYFYFTLFSCIVFIYIFTDFDYVQFLSQTHHINWNNKMVLKSTEVVQKKTFAENWRCLKMCLCVCVSF